MASALVRGVRTPGSLALASILVMVGQGCTGSSSGGSTGGNPPDGSDASFSMDATRLPDGRVIDPPPGDSGNWTREDGGGPPPTGTVRPGGVVISTNNYDNGRTGLNARESVLTPANVNVQNFGLLFSREVVGQIYAQPLYVEGVRIPNVGERNIVIVATQHNEVYAFDADDPAVTAPYWHVNMGTPVTTEEVMDLAPCPDLTPEVGITATPVIDPASGTVYIEAKSKNAGQYFHHLHALDLATGAEKFGGPREITAVVPGTGEGSENGMLRWHPLRQHVRPGLLMVNNTIYMASASHCDRQPYHGWVLAYDATTLEQRAVFNDTPNGEGGGIWMSGAGMSADDQGNVYFVSGDGSYDGTSSPLMLSNSVVKLRLNASAFEVVDWFTPYNQAELDRRDFDLGATTAMLIPGTDRLVIGSKEGLLYLLDRNRMGHHDPMANDSQILQRFLASRDQNYSHIHGTPVTWETGGTRNVYMWAEEDTLKNYRFVNGRFEETPIAQSAITAGTGMPGGILAVSANGNTAGSGIVWSSMPISDDSNQQIVPGMLRAFDAADVSRELWNSEMNPMRDHSGLYAKFAPPTVANGRVYVATFSNQLRVYGLLNR